MRSLFISSLIPEETAKLDRGCRLEALRAGDDAALSAFCKKLVRSAATLEIVKTGTLSTCRPLGLGGFGADC